MYHDSVLLGYLDEMLPTAQMSEVEGALRVSAELRQRVALLLKRRDQGGHTVGEIWRRHRLSCLSRNELGSYLLGTLEERLAEYAEFHLKIVGCRVCSANLHDLEGAQTQGSKEVARRRQRMFESSVGRLSRG